MIVTYGFLSDYLCVLPSCADVIYHINDNSKNSDMKGKMNAGKKSPFACLSFSSVPGVRLEFCISSNMAVNLRSSQTDTRTTQGASCDDIWK